MTLYLKIFGLYFVTQNVIITNDISTRVLLSSEHTLFILDR